MGDILSDASTAVQPDAGTGWQRIFMWTRAGDSIEVFRARVRGDDNAVILRVTETPGSMVQLAVPSYAAVQLAESIILAVKSS